MAAIQAKVGNRQWITGFYCLLIYLSVVLGFNLDTKAPIIKDGRPASYFGYSVAHHLVRHHVTGRVDSVFLVGAPRDNVTDLSAAPEVREIVRPGAVYQCPYTSLSDDCRAIKLDLEAPRSDEDKEDQWLGVSVASQGTEDGSAMACAHRYKTKGSSFRWGLGLCIALTNSLDQDMSWEPCYGLKKDIGHGEYGFCQAGISSAISQDGDFVLGAPGPYNWRGALFKNTLNKSLEVDNDWHQSPVEDPTPRIPGPQPATQYYSYLGMSVKIGHVLKGTKTFIGGAPRANDTGHVLLFKSNGRALTIEPEHILAGEQFGSYFGHDIAVGDFNLDGLEDIAVGAPFYRAPGVGGAIYIYMNSPEGITSKTKPLRILSRKMKDLECTEFDCHNARFGSSLASIGDLDRDGFDDLAVGAPYEGGGAVYIFRGSAKGIVKEFMQRIAASHFPTALPSAFGISIVGNFDVDQNGYPDVAIGAFTSDQLFVLRSRPVVNVMAVMINSPEIIDPKVTQCSKDGRHNICFEIKVCFQFTAEPVDRFNEKIDLVYVLEAEKFTGATISRVFFKGTDDKGDGYTIERTIRLNEQSKGDFKCREHVVYIMKTTKDYLSPIPFQLTYRLQNDADPSLFPGDRLPDMNSFPILNEAKTKQQMSVKFLKNCGKDDLCHSKLKLHSSLALNRDPDGYYVLRIGVDKYFNLSINIENGGEDAHETTVTVVVPEFLTYQGLVDEEQKYSCDPAGNVVSCFVGNPLPEYQNAKFGIRFDTGKALRSAEKYEIAVNVTTTSVENKTDDNSILLLFRVMVETDIHVFGFSDPVSVYFGGEVRGASSIKYEDEIGSEVKHSYEIKNVGHAPVLRSTLFVSWPYELQSNYPDGKYALYILEMPQLEGEGECFVDKSMINHLGIRSRPPTAGSNVTIGSKNGTRIRRESDVSPKVQRAADYRRQINFASVDCQDENTAKCYRFQCNLGEILPSKSTVLRIRARLWNSTFLEDFSHLDEVRISSYAEIVIDPKLNIHQPNTYNDIKKITTTAKPELQEPKPVPLWVIIVSVVAGVILLAVIILLLCKCGFFRRQQREQMMEHKAKKERKSYDEYHD